MDLELGDKLLSGGVNDRQALDDLFCLTYAELRRLASRIRRHDARATLNPTALVNEAWLKLAHSPQLGSVTPLHFKRIAARAMRQVLVEAARRRNSDKRGGGLALATLDEAFEPARTGGEDLLALDAALVELARFDPRQAAVIESRFFGGLDVSETAQALSVSEATVLRDWRAARAWLAHQLRRAP